MDFTPNTGVQKIARTNMGTRKHQAPRCQICFMLESLCVCSLAKDFRERFFENLNTNIHIIMHHREWKSTTNTSRLMKLLNPKCKIVFRGLKNETESKAEVASPEPITVPFEIENSFFLYPDASALDLTPENIQRVFPNQRPTTMIVPDGSWRQASKVYKREPQLKNIPLFKLAEPLPQTQYHLRREPRPDGFATFEAMAYALGVLESADTQNHLLEFFRVYVQKTLNSRKGIF